MRNEQPDKVRLTQTDGSRVELMAPEVRVDTVVGTVTSGDTVSIALSRVQKVEVRESDSLKGLGLFLGIVAVVAGLAVLMASGMDDMPIGVGQ